MDLRLVTRLAGLLGGLAWIVRLGLDLGGSSTGLDAWYVVGLVFLGIALAAAGAGLVSRGALWLRLIVALAYPLLAWSVLAVVSGSDGVLVPGAVGVVAVGLSAMAWWRTPSRERSTRRTARPAGAGSHAR